MAVSQIFKLSHPPAGTLTLTLPLTDLGAASIKLLVTAQDGEGVISAKPAEVTINVLHSARAPAMFHKSRYAFKVPEDAAPGTTVGTVEAMTSAGEGQSPEVCVVMWGGDRKFSPSAVLKPHLWRSLITRTKVEFCSLKKKIFGGFMYIEDF